MEGSTRRSGWCQGGLGTSPRRVSAFLDLDRERISYTTTVGGHRRIKRADIEDFRDRRPRAHDAMRDAMAAAEDIATEED